MKIVFFLNFIFFPFKHKVEKYIVQIYPVLLLHACVLYFGFDNVSLEVLPGCDKIFNPLLLKRFMLKVVPYICDSCSVAPFVCD
jgi:hypothetical protein